MSKNGNEFEHVHVGNSGERRGINWVDRVEGVTGEYVEGGNVGRSTNKYEHVGRRADEGGTMSLLDFSDGEDSKGITVGGQVDLDTGQTKFANVYDHRQYSLVEYISSKYDQAALERLFGNVQISRGSGREIDDQSNSGSDEIEDAEVDSCIEQSNSLAVELMHTYQWIEKVKGDGSNYFQTVIPPVPLSQYRPFNVSAVQFRELGGDRLEWLLTQYYMMYVALHAARCSYTRAAAQQVYVELTTAAYREKMAIEYAQHIGQGDKYGFKEFVLLLLWDQHAVDFMWQFLCKTRPRIDGVGAVLDSMQSVGMDDTAKRVAIWSHKYLLLFDQKLIMLCMARYSVMQVNSLLFKTMATDSLYDAIVKQKIHAFEVATDEMRLYLNYFGYLRNMVILRYIDGLDAFRKEFEPENVNKQDRGMCDVCGYNVVLYQHELRCRVSKGEKADGDDWIGDALVALDVRMVILNHAVPKQVQGEMFAGFTSNKYQAKYLWRLKCISPKTTIHAAGTVFEKYYYSRYRNDFIRHIVSEVGKEYKPKAVSEKTEVLVALMSVLGKNGFYG